MKELFLEMFNYNHFANRQLIEVFVENKTRVSEKSLSLFSHLLNANHIWNYRMNGQVPKYKVWEIQPIQDFKSIDLSNFEMSCKIVDNSDHEKIITYTNSQGNTYPNKIKEVLFHVINHSTYHRAQIASDLKQCGIAPPVTDYIAYKR